jgi:type III pantothenate kinase
VNLTVDIGNTSAKAALFDGERLVETLQGEARIARLPDVDKAIVCSTRGNETELERIVRRMARMVFVKFDHTTAVPLQNRYSTPATLGPDRLAAAVGGHVIRPRSNVLVVDFGTAITFDVVTAAGEYMGGNISPGAASRFRALHEHTGRLPQLGLPAMEDLSFPATDTKSAIESGVAMGIVAETERYITLAREKFGDLEIIFTGGDADYFAKLVKFPIFASSDIVFRGLNAILEHDANR